MVSGFSYSRIGIFADFAGSACETLVSDVLVAERSADAQFAGTKPTRACWLNSKGASPATKKSKLWLEIAGAQIGLISEYYFSRFKLLSLGSLFPSPSCCRYPRRG